MGLTDCYSPSTLGVPCHLHSANTASSFVCHPRAGQWAIRDSDYTEVHSYPATRMKGNSLASPRQYQI